MLVLYSKGLPKNSISYQQISSCKVVMQITLYKQFETRYKEKTSYSVNIFI